MKLIKIDDTILVQKKQSIIISTIYFLIYAGIFILFLASLFSSAWLSSVAYFVCSAFFALRWFSGSSFYTIQPPKLVENKIFQIPLKDDQFLLFVGASIVEAELFATLNGLSIEGIETLTEHAYSYP